ncbi:Fc.00g038530.m01.CDS01 [Cosmosporella sp. VM-42]
MRFWLDRGVDGFRLDVINFISKHQEFSDSHKSVLAGSEFYAAGPRLYEYLQQLEAILKEYNAFSVGEMPCVHDTKEILKSAKDDQGELNMIFYFELRFGDDNPAHRVQSAKMLAVFLGLQAGTPFIYQGQELGMHNVPENWNMEEYKDIDCLNHWMLKSAGADPEDLALFQREYQKKSRDNTRTPVGFECVCRIHFIR